MRLLFSFIDATANTRTTPRLRSGTILHWEYLPKLVGRLHRWIGTENPLHNEVSLYSLSNISGGRGGKNGLRFDERGGSFFISFFNDDTAKLVLNAAMSDRILFDGLPFEIDTIQIRLAPEPRGNSSRYLAASPILVRERQGDKAIDLSWDHPQANDILTQTLHTKLQRAGLPIDGRVYFDRDYTAQHKVKAASNTTRATNPFTKIVEYKGIHNLANVVPVIVEGPPEVQKFLWEVGAGHSTGSGFGALR